MYANPCTAAGLVLNALPAHHLHWFSACLMIIWQKQPCGQGNAPGHKESAPNVCQPLDQTSIIKHHQHRCVILGMHRKPYVQLMRLKNGIVFAKV